MTYEELFVAIAHLAKEISPAATTLLVHLVAKGINDGTNEVQASTRELERDTGMSRDIVAAAWPKLQPYLAVKSGLRGALVFHMPADWFAEGRGIFTELARVEKLPDWRENQASTGLEIQPLEPDLERATGGKTRPVRPRLAGKPGQYWRENQASQAATGGNSRPVITQNQQLADAAACRSIDLNYLTQNSSIDSIEHIACAKVLSAGQRADAMELSSWLCSYMREFGPPDRDQHPPDQQILARCLAVAPLGSLLSELKKMQQRHVRAGLSHAWFVSTFAQRLKDIPSNVLRAAFRRVARRRASPPQQDLDFSTQITTETFSKIRKIV